MTGEVKVVLSVDDIVVDNIVNRMKSWMGEEFLKLRDELADEVASKVRNELSSDFSDMEGKLGSDFSDMEDKIDEANNINEIGDIKDVVDEIKDRVDSIKDELGAEKVFVLKKRDEEF